jgi:DNA-binding NarL/FixJ family response regulator
MRQREATPCIVGLRGVSVFRAIGRQIGWSRAPRPVTVEDPPNEHDSPDTSPRVRVALLSPLRLFREGTARAIGDHPALEVVLSAEAVFKCRAALQEGKPDVIVIAARPDDTPSLVRDALRVAPHARVVVCGMTDDDASEVIACARAGAMGFVAPNASTAELIAVISSVARDEVRYATPLAGLVIRELSRLGQGEQRMDACTALTTREREIITLMSTHSNKAIAESLGIELSTVKSHVHSILAKLVVHRRSEAVAVLHASDESRRKDVSRPEM